MREEIDALRTVGFDPIRVNRSCRGCWRWWHSAARSTAAFYSGGM
jgi:hypothetical protein